MKKADRMIALALCCTLTLGAFAYRPPQAKAVAGVDDAIVISALLSAFGCGVGLIFSNNGMTSGQIADGIAKKWDEFNKSALSGAETFAGWLGYEDTSALLQAMALSNGKLVFSGAIARKLAEFTKWLTSDIGIGTDGMQKPVLNGYTATLSNGLKIDLGYSGGSSVNIPASSCLTYGQRWDFPSGSYIEFVDDYDGVYDKNRKNVHIHCYDSKGEKWDDYYSAASRGKFCLAYIDSGSIAFMSLSQYKQGESASWGCSYPSADLLDAFSVTGSDLSARQKDGASVPDVSGEKDTQAAISGVGDGTATSVEALLQQILDQLQTNTLSPTLTVDKTQTGDNTGTDDDAKPYLPYIPQIFEKIKDIPGTLSNIWETIKSIPATVAEKIGAFFTTLWGWLSDIITEIKALPAAIAEKVGALFKPDEALVTEITDTFKGKFGFFSTLKQFANDLFGMTADSEPPVIWVHLENAESKYGYVYGDKQKIFDLAWYQKYKASVDGLLSGFLWLGYLWLLFKRAPGILNGMSMDGGLLPPLQTGGDVSDAPRLGAGDPSMHYGNGFTFRDKGGRRK